MKTRKKYLKTSNKNNNNRSSVIVVKKSPIARRKNPRRINTSSTKKFKLYESPLKSLCNNGPEIVQESTTSSNSTKNEIEEETNKIDTPKDSTIISKETTHLKKKAGENSIEKDSEVENSFKGTLQRKCKRKNSIKLSSGKPKQLKKSKKGPLSKMNKTLSDSVIFLDSTLEHSLEKGSLNHKEEEEEMPNEKCSLINTNSEPSTSYSSEIIVIDDDDTRDHIDVDSNENKKLSDESYMEMEAYHDAFNEGQSSKSPKNLDSIICIEDDDLPVKHSTITRKAKSSEKEDCYVVWSSEPSTSSTSGINCLPDDPNILLYDKILVDTRPDLQNLDILNNDQVGLKRKRVNQTIKSNSKKLKTKVKPTNFDNISPIKQVPSYLKIKPKKKSKGDLIYQSESLDSPKKGALREIVIDGNNVAMAYTNNKKFSEKGIKLLIDYFIKKGHTVKVFVPQYRRSMHCPLLEKWNKEGIVVFTPSRKLGNKNFTPYDDRYILEYATACKGVVVSLDQFRDLYAEKPEYKDTIENRLLPPTFVGDYVMFPEDPLGRSGPTLTKFLKH